ncbi:MAG: hypothetical protein EOO01_03250 [Chitinophagaceae bacterium]|nr:MAG: hypothetical protein EOO01_03250 [Chitinophagaceae bacterium]
MSTSSAPDKRYFLNRLALEHDCDPLSLDPYWVLQQLFTDTPLEEMQELFSDFCEAAIAPVYNWKTKSPGSLLRFSEELEQMVEACFLVLAWVKHEKRASKKTPETPVHVIRKFFKAKNLQGWKHWLHSWTTGGLSACSVAEIVEPEDLLPFVQHMEKLLIAAEALSREPEKKV